MSRTLTRYSRNPPAISGTTLLIGAVLIALIVWVFLKNRQASPTGQYKNEEVWDISWNDEGLPTKVIVHRNAVRA